MQHRWMALGAANLTEDQARQWEAIDGDGVVGGRVRITFSEAICVVCLEDIESALPQCLGVPDDNVEGHFWQGFFTHPMTEEERAGWRDPEGTIDTGIPLAVHVVCLLCGSSAEASPDPCSARIFWTEESDLDLDPSQFR